MNMIRNAALGAVLALAAAAPAYAQDVLKVGGIGPLSGGGTAWGLATQRGAELAIDDINAAGGVKADGKTYKLELVMYDDLYTGQGGKAAAERLVNQEKVKFIIGPIGSPPALATIGVTNPAKVIALTNGYAEAVLKNENKDPYNFRIINTNIEFGPPIISWLKKARPEIKKIGMLAPNDAVGQAVATVLANDYRKQGYEVALDFFERGMKEFTPLILRMMAQKVDMFEFDGNSPGDVGLMVKQMRQAGFKGTLIQVGGPGIDEVIQIAGPHAEGYLSYDVFDWTTPGGQKLQAAYEKKYGKGIINAQMPAFYHATHLLAESINRAGSTDVDKVREAMRKTDGYDLGLYGPIRWSGEESYGVRHQILLPYYISEVKNGQVVKLEKLTP